MITTAAALAAFSLFASPAAGRVDALEANLDVADAERFAALYAAHDGAPDAAAIQAGYLDGAGDGVAIFTPHRIVSAENLARRIAAEPDVYRRGVEVCLPAARAASSDLRAIYLGFEGLLDDPRLPAAYAVFGANNSGGTVGENAIVLGLEVVCRAAPGDAEDVRAWLRAYFAHETVHTQQVRPDGQPSLLAAVLVEGGADFIGSLVAGRSLNPEIGAWAAGRDLAEIWSMFEADMARDDLENYGRWLYAGQPEDWPRDVGYWLGAEIARAYYDRADDKRQAIRDILAAAADPEGFLEASGYADRFGG